MIKCAEKVSCTDQPSGLQEKPYVNNMTLKNQSFFQELFMIKRDGGQTVIYSAEGNSLKAGYKSKVRK